MMKVTTLLVLATAALAAHAAPPKPAVTWDASPNYSASSRETSYNIDSIVIHTTEGKDTNGDGYYSELYTQAISWFNNPKAGVSAHYVISPSGAITQMVADDDIAWHATYYNSRSIGIECAGFSGKAATWTPALLEALSTLVAYLCDKYAVPVVHPGGNAYDEPDDTYKAPGLVAHAQIQPWSRSDPGAFFPWATFVDSVSSKMGILPPPAPAIVSPKTGTTVTTSTVFLDWTTVSAADYYQLKVFTAGGALVHTSWPTASSASVTLGAGSYVWHVWSHNSAGFSSSSAFAGLVVSLPPPSPAPTGMTPKYPDPGWDVVGTSVKLSWAAKTGATDFQVWLEFSEGGAWKYYYAWATGGATSKTVWPTMSKIWYRWKIRAKTSAGWGPWSDYAEFRFTNPTKS